MASNQRPRLRPALVPHWPPYLNFMPPGSAYAQELVDLGEGGLGLVWRLAPQTSSLVKELLQRSGLTVIEWTGKEMAKLDGPAWEHLLVCESCRDDDFKLLRAGAKLNKMPGTHVLCRKDKLWRAYQAMRRRWGSKFFQFLPMSYNLPEDMDRLRWKMKKSSDEIWIVKPPGASCGNGIKLVTKWSEIPQRESAHNKQLSVQKYIRSPFLVNGLKSDLRLYVLLTSIQPIRLYLYNDGLVRFATRPYTCDLDNLADKMVHLTNYSVNKYNEDFEHNEAPSEFSGHKWSLQTFWKYLEKEGHDPSKIKTRINNLVIKTILCGHKEMARSFNEKVKSDYTCYKLFGVDVFLDSALKPWLLEVNNFPSLEPNSLDRHVNEPMLAEMMNIIGFHLPLNLPTRQQKLVREAFGFSTKEKLLLDERLYIKSWKSNPDKTEEEEEEKEEDEMDGEEVTVEELTGLVEESNLQGRDLRNIVRAEEELNQCDGFQRLLPRPEGLRFLRYLGRVSHDDRVLQAWESGPGGQHQDRGRSLLVRACEKGRHLEGTEVAPDPNKEKGRKGPRKLLIESTGEPWCNQLAVTTVRPPPRT